ncbi:MAG: hypothetical protein AB7I30_16325, partial [Isosphaeraceae bacterium]
MDDQSFQELERLVRARLFTGRHATEEAVIRDFERWLRRERSHGARAVPERPETVPAAETPR